MKTTIVTLTALLYNFAILAGTVYLIQVHDWSMWTFLLTILFWVSVKTKEVEEDVVEKRQS